MGASLYILCFPNGKLYVGITRQRVERRFQRHKRSTAPVGCALFKYGPENVRIVVLHRDRPWAEACELERFYIQEFGTRIEAGGYNLTDGGEGVLNPPTESRQRMSEKAISSRKRQWQNSTYRRRTIESVRRYWRSPLGRNRRTSANCRHWQDCGYREKMLEAAAKGRQTQERNRILRKIGNAWRCHTHTWSGSMALRKAIVC